MKENKIIFGIEHVDCSNIFFVYLGYKDTWETTKDAYGSLIFVDELGWYGNDELRNKIPLDNINLPGSIDDDIYLGYTISLETPIDLVDVFKNAGFEHCLEFEKAIINYFLDLEENED